MESKIEHQVGNLAKHTGGCHCGAIRFEVMADLQKGAGRCNCSICTKIAQTGAIVKPADFTFVAREGTLGAYAWGHKISTRHFCTNCGIHVFGRGHLDVLGGDYVSVNLNCLDEVDVNLLPIHHWDGRHDNWQSGPRPSPWPLHPAS